MTDRQRFPPLEHPSFFLASPGDVAYLRMLALDLFGDLSGRVADGRDLQVYAWEVDTSPDGFRDDRPVQEQIHRPDDPLCRGVMCFFGG